jgi:tetratricopeptide (TPR) repeat protein
MGIAAFLKNHFQVSRYIGRGDYSRAIHILESSLSNNAADIPSLEMIAHCYRWSQQNDKAIATAEQLLAYDAKNFAAARLLSEIYAEQNEDDAAAKFARLGMENYPEPSPATPKIVFWFLQFLHLAAKISPRFKRIAESAKRDLSDPDSHVKEWYLWAKQYLAWYDASVGNEPAKSPLS